MNLYCQQAQPQDQQLQTQQQVQIRALLPSEGPAAAEVPNRRDQAAMLMAMISGGDPSSSALAAALQNPTISLLTPDQRAQLERIRQEYGLLESQRLVQQSSQQGGQTDAQLSLWVGGDMTSVPSRDDADASRLGKQLGVVNGGRGNARGVAVGGRGASGLNVAGGRGGGGDNGKDMKDLSSWCCYRRLGESFAMLDVGLDATGNVVDLRGGFTSPYV